MHTDDMILVSVDDHVVEPPDLFARHLPAKYRDLAPHVVHKDDGTDVWQFLEIEVPNIGLNAVAGRPPEEYGIEPTSFDELRPGCFDVEARVLDMSANGVLGSLCFPSLPGFAGRLFAALEDKDAALALARAYNDWHIDEWCGAQPGRFIPLSVPTIWDPNAMAAEVRRVAQKGCHAVTFPENPVPLGLPSLHSDHWDPFWAACSDEGTIVCMHIGSSSKLVVTAPDAPIDVMIVLQPMNIVLAAADLVYSPVFKKFPDVTVALSEGDGDVGKLLEDRGVHEIRGRQHDVHRLEHDHDVDGRVGRRHHQLRRRADVHAHDRSFVGARRPERVPVVGMEAREPQRHRVLREGDRVTPLLRHPPHFRGHRVRIPDGRYRQRNEPARLSAAPLVDVPVVVGPRE